MLRHEAETYRRFAHADREETGGYPRCPPNPFGLVRGDRWTVWDEDDLPLSRHTSCQIVKDFGDDNSQKPKTDDETLDDWCDQCPLNKAITDPGRAEVFPTYWSRLLMGALTHIGASELRLEPIEPLTNAERRAIEIVNGVTGRRDPPPKKKK